MERLELRDFSGGISEQYAPEGFSERQWAKLKGFVIDTDYSIRSQWAAQSIGSLTDVAAVHGFRGNENSYLVALKTNGTLWWCVAPTNSATYTTANSVVWTQLTTDEDSKAIAASVYYRFIGEVLLPVKALGEVNALLINAATTQVDNAIGIYENDNYDPPTDTRRLLARQWTRREPVDQPNLIDPLVGEDKQQPTAWSGNAKEEEWTQITGFTSGTTSTVTGTRWTIANDGDYTVRIKLQGVPDTIANVAAKDSYTHTSALGLSQVLEVRIFDADAPAAARSAVRVGITLGTYPLAQRDVMPRANVGTMWRNRLILGDIQKRRNPSAAWSSSNRDRAKFALFYSEVEPDSFREQAILYAGSGESQIVGMHVLDDYLITVSSAETEIDGVRLFRGTLDYLRLQNNEVTLSINVLRGGIGPAQESGIATQNLSPSCVWPEAGVVVFLDSLGGIWYTDGVETDRLDKTGPIMPDVTTPNDEVAALGKYLFAWRAGRLLVLNILSGVRGESATAAWTEVVLPTGAANVKSFCPVGGNMYFVMNGQVWRFAMSRNNQADTERASFNGTKVLLTVASATIADQDKHAKVNWFNYGVRARGRTALAIVRDAKMIAGPALDATTASYTTALNRQIQDRDEFVVKCGVGFRTEGSAEITMEGDVQIESMSFWTSGLRASRPANG